MMENEELYARIEELEKELAEERIRRKITEDNSDCALWEYEIATKKYVLSRKLGGKWNTTNMVIENYQEQMHKWGFVHPDDWSVFDAFCEAMDRGDEHISYEVRQVSDESVFIWFRYVGIPVYDKDHKPYKIMGKTLDITGEKKNQELYQKADQALYRVKRSGKNAFSVYDKNYNYVDYTSDRKGTDRETGLWQELEKYYKGRQWTESESEVLSTMTRMMESYLNREEGAGIVREQEKDTEKPEPVIAGTETPESFSAKLEQILPWQDGQYAEVFLAIRDYDEISGKMSEEELTSLIYHLGTHIHKHMKGQEMVCHVKKDEFLLLLDNNMEPAAEKIGHIMIMFEAMISDKYPDVPIKLYSGIYYLESRGYRPEEIFRIGKTLKNKAKRYYTVDNSIYENRKSAGNVIDKEAGILNRGNLTRLKNFLNRAAQGERLTVGFIGGSITQGFAATDPDKCYAARTVAWLRKVFPNTEFDYVNAGIGATNSQFGAARVQEDLLCRLPDLVMVEFSVNDHSTPHDRETYEGLVRQIYGGSSHPAMVLLHSVYYDTGKSAAYYHAQIGRHYDLPCISMQNSIYPAVAAGKLPAEKITADFLHPNEIGHEFIA